ncbi:MAG: hypothetical protein ABI411_12005, partial [Tahibacter sp.]
GTLLRGLLALRLRIAALRRLALGAGCRRVLARRRFALGARRWWILARRSFALCSRRRVFGSARLRLRAAGLGLGSCGLCFAAARRAGCLGFGSRSRHFLASRRFLGRRSFGTDIGRSG